MSVYNQTLDFACTYEGKEVVCVCQANIIMMFVFSFPAIQSGGGLPFPAGSRRPLLGGPNADEDSIEEALGLGELAGLTVNNEADVSYDVSVKI